MNLTLYTGNLRVERDIAPPMRLVVTLPVYLDNQPTDLAVYVMVTPFALDSTVGAVDVRRIAQEIAHRVNGTGLRLPVRYLDPETGEEIKRRDPETGEEVKP